jgi:primase-polymerase (primpol)-like protein
MNCSWCAAEMTKRQDAVTCSTRCRVAKSRAAFPQALTTVDHWVRHKNKVPLTVNNSPASSTNAETWSTFDRARDSAVGDGLGFVLTGDGIACIDLDHCLVDGVLTDWAQTIVNQCPGTYIEVSLSGTGLHIFGYATVGAGRRRDGVEVYDRARFIAVTGRRWRRCPLKLSDISVLINSL